MCTTRYPVDSIQNGNQSRPGSLEDQTISCYRLESNPDYLAVYSTAHSLYLVSNRAFRFREIYIYVMDSSLSSAS